MKADFLILAFCIAALALAAGCTGQQPAAQPTAVTTAPATTTTAAPAEPAVPAGPVGSWTLTTMAIQGGTAINYPTADITITFRSDGTLYGYTGCNNYNAAFSVSGETTEKGTAIAIGPVEATLKYCESIADQETTYLAILKDAMAYDIDGNQLTITAHDGNALIFQTPASLQTQVPERGY